MSDEKIPFCPDCNSPVEYAGDGVYKCPLDGLLHDDEIAWVSDYELVQLTPDDADEDDDLDYCQCGMGLDADGLCPSCDKGGAMPEQW